MKIRERLPSIATLLLLTALVIGTWWAAHYTSTTIELDPPRKLTHEPDAWATDIIMLSFDEQGHATNRLEGTTMVHYPDDDSCHLKAITARISNPNQLTTTGTANTAIMDQNNRRIQMIGNAHIRREPDSKGHELTISSEQLTLLPKADQVHTAHPAVVVDGPHTLEGKGMFYDNRQRQLHVYEQSRVIMKPSTSTSTSTNHE